LLAHPGGQVFPGIEVQREVSALVKMTAYKILDLFFAGHNGFRVLIEVDYQCFPVAQFGKQVGKLFDGIHRCITAIIGEDIGLWEFK